MRASTLDDIDRQLLDLLQDHGRMAQQELAQAVGLSSPAVSERLRKLEERGILRAFTAIIDPKQVGRDVTAFITVVVESSRDYPAFIEHARACAEILECHAITGEGSHLLKVRTENTSTLEQLLAVIQSWPGVHGTLSSIVLSTAKETSRLSLTEQTPPAG